MMVLIRFWRSLTKKTMLRELDMKYNIFFYFNFSFRTFFHGSGFIRIGPEFLADPDPDSEKKSDPDPGKKTRTQNTEKYSFKASPPSQNKSLVMKKASYKTSFRQNMSIVQLKKALSTQFFYA